MPILQAGSINTTALVVPDLYVQIVPPSTLSLNGVPSNVIGAVGTASWGPVGQPVIVGSASDYFANFGPVLNRKFDMGTAVSIAIQQGAQAFRCVRVTDGTDASAQSIIASAGGSSTNFCLFFSGLYTGSVGNGILATLDSGSKSGTAKLTLSAPNFPVEVFDNVPGSGITLWANIASAVNSGQSARRGPSQLATCGAGTGANAAAGISAFSLPYSTPFSSGSDGATSATAATLVGVDTIPRKGMYALRGQGCSIGMLADADDSTQWSVQSAFGLSEGVYIMLVSPAGSAIVNGTTGTVDRKQSAGIDTYAAKVLHGDWVSWYDQANQTTRLVSPQGFAAGRLANLSPEQSSLNKPLYGVIGTQKSGGAAAAINTSYSAAELAVLGQNGVDVIANPAPGGDFWALRFGHNSAYDATVNGDNYTRLTNYIASSLAAGMGKYVGQLVNSKLFDRVKATLSNFLHNLLSQGVLGSLDGSVPFTVVCDLTNNPQSRTSLGYVQADVQVQYQAINEKFIVNLQGGQTVSVTKVPSYGATVQ